MSMNATLDKQIGRERRDAVDPRAGRGSGNQKFPSDPDFRRIFNGPEPVVFESAPKQDGPAVWVCGQCGMILGSEDECCGHGHPAKAVLQSEWEEILVQRRAERQQSAVAASQGPQRAHDSVRFTSVALGCARSQVDDMNRRYANDGVRFLANGKVRFKNRGAKLAHMAQRSEGSKKKLVDFDEVRG